MITDHGNDLPKNRFAELDELERRERLDNWSRTGMHGEGLDPRDVMSYNGLFSYPFVNAVFPPAAAPLIFDENDGEDKRLS